MSEQSIWDETFDVIRRILGLRANPISQKSSKGQPMRKDMFRLDLSHKGPGWMGNIPMDSGHVMSELSVGAPGTDEGFFPLIVPGMPQESIDRLKQGGAATAQDYSRARDHAKYMRKQGKGPFAPGGYKPERDYERTHPPTPRKLKPMTQDEVDQWGAQYQNRMVSEQLRQPGAMILDTPLSRARSEKEMMDDFNRTGITQRPGTLLKEKDLPPGTLTTRAIGKKR
jgi:hypothetical protein